MAKAFLSLFGEKTQVFFFFVQFPNNFLLLLRIISLKSSSQRDGSQVLEKMGVENLYLKGTEKVSKFSPRSFGINVPITRGLGYLLLEFFLFLGAGQFCFQFPNLT